MQSEDRYKIGPWVFTPGLNEVSNGHTTHRLEDRASRVLEFLCHHPGEVVTKEDLIEAVWQGRHLSEQSVPVVISQLRKALSLEGEKSASIETIPKKGYRLVAARKLTGVEKELNRKNWLWAVPALVAIFIIGFLVWPQETPKARKPGIVLTLNDIQNATGDEEMMKQVIAMSEAGSYYLSKIDEVLLIRHWWNVEVDDPTGGIFERYGEDAPIYHVAGTLIGEGDNLSVTLFLNDPRTDEVLWSEAYPVTKDGFLEVHLENLGKVLAFLGVKEQISPPGSKNSSGEAATEYWLGLYFWYLGTEGAAMVAQERWTRALELDPGMEAARAGLQALDSRWPNLFENQTHWLALPDAGDEPSLLLQAAAIALYQEGDIKTAEAFVRKALEISPNDHAAYGLLAEILVREGKAEEALLAIREAEILAPYSQAYPEREMEIAEAAGDSN